MNPNGPKKKHWGSTRDPKTFKKWSKNQGYLIPLVFGLLFSCSRTQVYCSRTHFCRSRTHVCCSRTQVCCSRTHFCRSRTYFGSLGLPKGSCCITFWTFLDHNMQGAPFGDILIRLFDFWDKRRNGTLNYPASAVPELTFAVPELILDDFSWFLEPRSSISHNFRNMFGMLFGYVFHIVFLVVDICFYIIPSTNAESENKGGRRCVAARRLRYFYINIFYFYINILMFI